MLKVIGFEWGKGTQVGKIVSEQHQPMPLPPVSKLAKHKVLFRRSSDFEGLYIDGKRVLANHTLNVYDVLNALGIEFKKENVSNEDFPESL